MKELAPWKLNRYPVGWYCVGFSDEIKKGKTKIQEIGGKDVVLFRTEKGEIKALDSICPHLGAHLGYGGKVVKESIRCPYHGLCFKGDGSCENQDNRQYLKTNSFPIKEVFGIIMLYLGPSEIGPKFELPELKQDGWSSLRYSKWTVRGHVQDMAENNFDYNHFSVVHGYSNLEIIDKFNSDGPLLKSKVSMTRHSGILGKKSAPINVGFETQIYGLGFSYIQTLIKNNNLRLRQFVLGTPRNDEQIDVRIAVAIKLPDKISKIHPLLNLVPKSWVKSFTLKQVHKNYIKDFKQDLKIWDNKEYFHPPNLISGDGPITQYRFWAKQFYEGPGISLQPA